MGRAKSGQESSLALMLFGASTGRPNLGFGVVCPLIQSPDCTLMLTLADRKRIEPERVLPIPKRRYNPRRARIMNK
jgi:hypothetical protein